MGRNIFISALIYIALISTAIAQEFYSFETDNREISKEIIFILQKFGDIDQETKRTKVITAEVTPDISEEDRGIIRKLAQEGGLSGLAAQLALEQISTEKHLPPLIWSKLYYHVNKDRGSGYVDVTAQRKGWPLKRWVVSVLAGGFKVYTRRTPGNERWDRWKYKMQAEGKTIRMMAYYEDTNNDGILKLVTRFRDDGTSDPRYRFYQVRDDACIDIYFENEPLAEDEMPDGFCIARCAFPGIYATK